MEIKEHIYKSNSLIDCSYKLSLSEQRLISLGCKKLKPIFVDKNITIEEFKILVEANIFEPIEITVPEYKAEFGVKSNNVYGEMKSIVDSLYERSIVYYDNKGKLTKKRWVITSVFDEEIKSVIIKFHPDLLVDLLVFKGQYTKLNYSFLTTVKNSYVGRIYELLRQYLFIKKRYFEISELRFKLNLLDGEYPKYGNLKQKILNPAKEWINTNSDIHIEFTENKKGRSVVGLNFTITPRNVTIDSPKLVTQQISLNEHQLSTNSNLYSTLKTILGLEITGQETDDICQAAIDGLAENNITNLGAMDYIKEQWNNVLNYSKNNKIDNYISCLIVALKKNWVSPKLVIQNKIQKPKQTSFHNFTPRQYDFEALEEMALGHSEYDPGKLYK